MMLSLLIALLLGKAQAAGLEPLRSNGALFTRAEERLPLRCLEAADLLDQPSASQDSQLDRAASAGFNSLSFNAPAFGESGFCKKLGSLDSARLDAFKALLAKFEVRGLYAFPVLWSQASVAAFSRIGGGDEKFFSGKIQNQWQAWLTREFAKNISGTASVGGIILYRGPWPGPKKRGVEESDAGGAQAFSAPLRNWLLWQMRALRLAGAQQLAGCDLLLKGDLGEKAASEDPALGKAESALPVADMKPEETKPEDPASLDRLPPLPGQDKLEGESATAEALTPWDLEGVDWDSVGRALREIPVSTGLDFMELTLDTEDWYRVGEAMGSVAEKEMQAPLLWRHDWRSASRYERQKRLEAPEGVAGLAGAWPDNDWPEAGESIWQPSKKSRSLELALAFKYMEVLREDGKPVLALHLNRPCSVELDWDKKWPPAKRAASKDPSLIHKLTLKGAKFGDTILICARASSKRQGRAVLRSRWIKLQAPPPKPKGAKANKA